MQYVMLKSGAIIRFNTEKVELDFNEDGYFVGDVGLHLSQTQREGASNLTSFIPVESFTFHETEMSCHWLG